MKKVLNDKGGTMHQFEKGESGNPNGRPKKIQTILKGQGYKLSEINDTIQQMLHLDIETLKRIWDNPKATVLEKTIAQALRKSMEKGKLDSVETLLTRVYGKPKEKVEQQLNITNKVIKLKFGNEEGDI